MARRQAAPFGNKVYEDPSIAQCAALEFERLQQRIAAKVELGVWYYRARTLVMAEELVDIRKAYGRKVATRVEAALNRMGPEHLPEEHQRKMRAQTAKATMDHLTRTRGRVSWLNRWWIERTGYALY